MHICSSTTPSSESSQILIKDLQACAGINPQQQDETKALPPPQCTVSGRSQGVEYQTLTRRSLCVPPMDMDMDHYHTPLTRIDKVSTLTLTDRLPPNQSSEPWSKRFKMVNSRRTHSSRTRRGCQCRGRSRLELLSGKLEVALDTELVGLDRTGRREISRLMKREGEKCSTHAFRPQSFVVHTSRKWTWRRW